MRLNSLVAGRKTRTLLISPSALQCSAAATVEQLEQRMMLAGDLQVRQIIPLGDAPLPFDRLEVAFNRPVQADSFTADDVQLIGDEGTIAPASVTALADDRFEIDFAGTSPADLRLRIGPDILDLDGMALNQDGDATAGEVEEDVYRLTLVSTGLWIDVEDLAHENGGLLIHGGDVTLTGSHQFAHIDLLAGGTLAIDGAAAVAGAVRLMGESAIIAVGRNTVDQIEGAWAGQGATIDAVDIYIEAGSRITADGQGYAGYAGYGDGRGPGAATGESGGTHGGVGSSGIAQPQAASVYGDALAPTEPGSSGAGGFWGTGGSGGGAIRLNVSGTLELNGSVSADGETISGQGGGGGSGGSIFVNAHTLAGTGIFSARGGSNTTDRGGGGGGGRIAVHYSSADNYTGFAGSTAAAGTGTGVLAQDGTVVFADTGVANGHLQIHQNFVIPQDTIARYGAITVGSGATLTIGGGSVITVDGAFNITGNSTVIAQGKNTGGMVDGGWAGEGVSISAGSMFIESGSRITADAQGHVGRASSSGFGPGAWDTTTDSGGSHGGVAGSGGAPSNPTQPYGNAWTPTDIGSAGGGWFGATGGSGGGAIQLSIAGILHLDGRISADGQTISIDAGSAGGGSGGSIHLQTDTLRGTGSLSAIGGSNPFNRGGGGSGGRIAAYYESAAEFGGFVASSVAGGTGSGTLAEAGTMVFVDRSLANHHLHLHDRFVLAADTAATFGAITLADGATLIIGGGSAITVDAAIRVTGNSTIIAQAKDIWTPVDGKWAGRGVSIAAQSVFVEAGSSINADGQGYAGHYDAPGAGPGAADSTNNAGGSHGGLGGRGNATYNDSITYGDAMAPVDLGSAGGFWNYWTGASGGGAINMRIDGALRIDGTISANGASLPTDIGGGAGAAGSVYIVAGSVLGEGTISADGGDAQASRGGGGGGGGRIAIHTGTWNASAQFRANGGAGHSGGSGGSVAIYAASAPATTPALSADGTAGSVNTGTAGAAALHTTPDYLWTGDIQPYLHDTETLNWMGLCVDPSLRSTDLIAVRGNNSYAIAAGVGAIGSMSWDTRGVPDGVYELMAIFRGPGGILGTARRSVLVNNAAQWHAGTIGSNETWPANKVHLVEANVMVAPGVTVTIEPGAVVKFAPGTMLTIGDGATLDASGALDQPILFTSMLDDTAGGTTNPDPLRLMARPGDWRGLAIQGAGQLNINEHTEQRYMMVTHSGTLSASETWQSGALHSITGNVTVPAGMTLTIQPGAVIQFDADRELNLAPGAQLIAQGTVAQPIRFTSWREDADPAAGDWRWIYLDSATAVFDHVDMRYGGGNASGWWDNTGMIRTAGNASLTISNSVLRDAFYDGVLVWGGEATIRNTIVAGADRGISAHPDSIVQVINCTIDDNRIGLLSHGGAMDVANTIVSNSLGAGIQYDFGPAPTVRYSNVWAGAANAPRFVDMTDLAGQQGNISADPRYRSAAEGDYRLRYASPAIDSADGAAASTTDFAGSPRYDDPRSANTGAASAGGAWADMGAFEFVENADSNFDLAASNVSGPATAVAGQTVAITWTVVNRGSVPITGPWHDRISLAFNGALITVADVLVGDGKTLTPGQSIDLSASVVVPGGLPMDYHWHVEANARNVVFEGANRGNNAALSARTVALGLPQLVAGAPASGQFTAVGQTAWYKIVPAAGQNLTLSLSTAGSGIELYGARGRVPTPSSFDTHSTASSLAILSPTGEPWYIIAHARNLASPAAFTLAASVSTFAVDAVAPSTMNNSGPVTLQIRGSELSTGATYQLVDANGTPHFATSVTVPDSTTSYATFNLNSAAAGVYGLRVLMGNSAATLSAAVHVVAAPAAHALETSILLPSRFRANRPFTGHIVYRNSGNVDIAAPILVLSSNGQAGLRLASTAAFSTEDLILVGGSFEGPAGILRPGQEWQIPFSALASTTADLQFQLSYKTADSTDAVDWASVATQVRPAGMADGDWQPIWQRFTAAAGATWGGFVQTMARYATTVGQSGGTFYSAQEVFTAALRDSYAASRASASGTLYLNGQPLAGAMLVLSTSDGTEAGAAISNADGVFRFLGLPAGNYTLRVRDHLLSQPVQIVVPPTGEVSGLGIAVTRGGIIAGTIRRGSDYARLANVAVTLRSGGVLRTINSDEYGEFRFAGLPDGSYELSVGGGEWATYGHSTLTIAGGNTITGIDFAIVPGGTARGRILASATPLAGASVSLISTGGAIFSQATDSDGAYVITGLAPGLYTVSVFADGHGPVRTVADISTGAVTVLEDISLAAAATLAVTVNDGASPITLGLVQLLHDGQQMDITAISAAATAAFTNLAAGEYTLVVDAPGYDAYSTSLTLTAGQPLSQTCALASNTAAPESANEGDDAQADVPAGADPITGMAYGAISQALITMFRDYLEDRNPEPEQHPEDHFPPLPSPNFECPAAVEAWRDAIFLADSKRTAWERWHANHESFNTTVWSSALIYATQATTFVSSIVSTVVSGGVTAELQAASGAVQGSLVLLQFIQMAQSLYSLTESVIGNLDTMATTGELGVDAFIGMFNDLGGQAGGVVGMIDTIETIGGVDGGSIGGNFANAMGIIGSLTSLILGTLESAKHFINQANTVVDGQDEYLHAFAQYKAARAALARANENCDEKPDPEKAPTPGNPTRGAQGGVPSGISVDPNDKHTIGVGQAGYIRPGQLISYLINFENQPSATLPAQLVTITDTLDPNLDWSTLQLTSVGFNGASIQVPAGLTHYQTTTFVGTDPNPVRITITFNPATGVLTWMIESFDAMTGVAPEDPLAGFLPPNNALHQGEGFVTFTIKARADLSDTATITNQARIVFDDNAPIDTNQTLNTIDSRAPQASVLPLPAATRWNQFLVSWAGNDTAAAGVAGYDVYVSAAGGPHQLWLSNTPATTALFTGQNNVGYAFYAIARDHVGNTQPTPLLAQAAVTVDTAAPMAKLSRLAAVKSGQKVYRFTVVYSDNLLVYRRSIGTKDILVLGPRKFKQYAKLISAKSTKAGRVVSAVYQITAPGGAWDSADKGTYAIWTNTKQILDTAMNASPRRRLGTFKVKTPAPATPRRPIRAAALVTASPLSASINPVFSTRPITGAADAESVPCLPSDQVAA